MIFHTTLEKALPLHLQTKEVLLPTEQLTGAS